LLLWEQKFDQNKIAAQECLELYRLCGDKYGEVDALLLLGDMESNLQALVLSESLGDLARQAQALVSMAWYDNDYQRRVTNMEEAISLYKKIGDFESAIEHIIWLGNFELVNGNLQTAQGWVKEVSRVSQSLNNKRMKAEILLLYGNVALAEGNYERARFDVNEAVMIWEHLGFRWGMLWANARLGYIALREGNLKDAYAVFAKTAQEFQKDKSKIGVVFTLEGMAGLEVSGDKHGRAACLIGWADATREKIAGIRPRLEQADVDKVTAACIAAMGETAFSEAYDKGQKMTMEQAVAYALEEHS
jgi:tetratricopeptide (TPR) repeat protein